MYLRPDRIMSLLNIRKSVRHVDRAVGMAAIKVIDPDQPLTVVIVIIDRLQFQHPRCERGPRDSSAVLLAKAARCPRRSKLVYSKRQPGLARNWIEMIYLQIRYDMVIWQR